MAFPGEDAGYRQLRRIFDFVRSRGLIGPRVAGGWDERNDDEAPSIFGYRC